MSFFSGIDLSDMLSTGLDSAGTTLGLPPGASQFALGIGSSILGSKLDVISGRDKLRANTRYLQSLGLTPQEIVGSPAVGGTSTSAATQSLTNNNSQYQQALLQTQQQREANLLQSQTQLETAKIAADAHIKAKELEVGATARGQDLTRQSVLDQLAQTKQLTDAQSLKVRADADLAVQELSQKRELHNERWERLFASMGPENVMASVFAVMHGLPIKDVMLGVPSVNRQTMRAYVNEIIAARSRYRSEFLGASEVSRLYQDTMRAVWEVTFDDKPSSLDASKMTVKDLTRHRIQQGMSRE